MVPGIKPSCKPKAKDPIPSTPSLLLRRLLLAPLDQPEAWSSQGLAPSRVFLCSVCLLFPKGKMEINREFQSPPLPPNSILKGVGMCRRLDMARGGVLLGLPWRENRPEHFEETNRRCSVQSKVYCHSSAHPKTAQYLSSAEQHAGTTENQQASHYVRGTTCRLEAFPKVITDLNLLYQIKPKSKPGPRTTPKKGEFAP